MRNPIRVLIVDDGADTLEWMKIVLEHDGYAARTADSGAAAEQIRDSWRPQLVLMDLELSDVDGTELLARFKEAAPSTELIMIGGHGSVARAVDAMKAGAYSFIEKPVDPDVLLAVMEKALERLRLSDENQRLREQLKVGSKFGNIVGISEKMQQLFQIFRHLQASPTSRGANVAQFTLAEIERLAILQALECTSGNKRAAADILGIYRPTLYGKLRKHKLGGYGKSGLTQKTGEENQPTRARVRRA